MVGSVMVEFAGSRKEAKEYAKENGVKHAQNKGCEPNGNPYLSLWCKNSEEFEAAIKKFDSLGWDRDSLIIHSRGKNLQ